jgi:hypothetical protein
VTDHIILTGLRTGSVIFGLAAVSDQPPVGGVTETTRTGWHTKGRAAAGHHQTPSFLASLFGRASRTGRRQPQPDESFDGGHGAQGDPATAVEAHETPVVDRAAAVVPEQGRRPAHTLPAERLDPKVEAAYRTRSTR